MITEMIRRSTEKIIEMLQDLPSKISSLTVAEWAESKRVLPAGTTSMPGPFSWDVAPFMREIADCLSESSPVERVAVMKSAQVTYTVGALENAIGYIIDAAPGPTLFVSADEQMAQTAVELRVDRMIESAGLTGKIRAQTEKRHSKKTGDTKAKKEFAGGFLLAYGPNSGGKLRSFSIQYVLGDEIDAWPQVVGGEGKRANEGDVLALLERRTAAFEGRRKMLYGSTPLVEHNSRIMKLHREGDQRVYMVPCKHCGTMQNLKWENLKWDTDQAGRLDWSSVRYECESCSGIWKNDDKAFFLPEKGRGGMAEWVPTATPEKPTYRSYHINALYSPLGMTTWEDMAFEWLKRKDDPTQLQTFVNTYLGEPWQDRHNAPRYEKIMLYREGYDPGELPNGARALLVTVGADIQKDRIEAEIVAWGRDKVSWSVDYKVFPGDTSDPGDDCWEALRRVIEQPHAGLPVSMALIDSGYNTPVVYDFCDAYYSGVHPVMGDMRVGRRKTVFVRTPIQDHQCERVDLYTDALKQELYTGLTRVKNPEDPDPPGYCHFPTAYTAEYFQQLTAEERVKEIMRTGQERYIWRKHRTRNEAHDCRVYAMGALNVYAFDVMESMGAEQIVWSAFWDWISTKE